MADALFEGFADTSDARLWYWDTRGSGVPVVLCHPASQGCQIWNYQRSAFSEAGYRVIAYSRRGYDRSEPGAEDDLGTTIGDLTNLLDAIGIDRAHILGAAAGGITAVGFAVAHASRVRSLILAATIVSPAEAAWQTMYERLGIAAVHSLVSTEFLELGPTYRATNPDGTLRFSQLSAQARAARPRKQPLGTIVNWKTLESMSRPTLLIAGEADLFAPPPLLALVAQHIADHRLETMREVGHAPYWEQPDTFNALVLDFLNGRQP